MRLFDDFRCSEQASYPQNQLPRAKESLTGEGDGGDVWLFGPVGTSRFSPILLDDEESSLTGVGDGGDVWLFGPVGTSRFSPILPDGDSSLAGGGDVWLFGPVGTSLLIPNGGGGG